tara:strand:+ start:409 stop:675 length:267 start_codon:yes stop_codon:yes gene_type:complete
MRRALLDVVSVDGKKIFTFHFSVRILLSYVSFPLENLFERKWLILNALKWLIFFLGVGWCCYDCLIFCKKYETLSSMSRYLLQNLIYF